MDQIEVARNKNNQVQTQEHGSTESSTTLSGSVHTYDEYVLTTWGTCLCVCDGYTTISVTQNGVRACCEYIPQELRHRLCLAAGALLAGAVSTPGGV